MVLPPGEVPADRAAQPAAANLGYGQGRLESRIVMLTGVFTAGILERTGLTIPPGSDQAKIDYSRPDTWPTGIMTQIIEFGLKPNSDGGVDSPVIVHATDTFGYKTFEGGDCPERLRDTSAVDTPSDGLYQELFAEVDISEWGGGLRDVRGSWRGDTLSTEQATKRLHSKLAWMHRHGPNFATVSLVPGIRPIYFVGWTPTQFQENLDEFRQRTQGVAPASQPIES